MANIKTLTYMSVILPLLLENGLDERNLQIEENPYTWAKQKNLPNCKEGMIGYSLSETNLGKKLIILKDEITDKEQEETLQRIAYPVDRGRKAFLSKPEKFIEHLIRHELENCVFGKPQGEEHEVDEEVLKKMGFIENATGF